MVDIHEGEVGIPGHPANVEVVGDGHEAEVGLSGHPLWHHLVHWTRHQLDH